MIWPKGWPSLAREREELPGYRANPHLGQLLHLVSIEHPTGGTPARAEAYLLCRRP